MAKLAAKKYGDRLDQTATGTITVTCVNFADADKAE